MNPNENPRIALINGDAYLAGAIKAIVLHEPDSDEWGDDFHSVQIYFGENDSRRYTFPEEKQAVDLHKQAIRMWQLGLGDVVIVDEIMIRPLHR